MIIDLTEEDERELQRTLELIGKGKAVVLRTAIRPGLQTIAANFQTARPVGSFADAYKPNPERERLERAASGLK